MKREPFGEVVDEDLSGKAGSGTAGFSEDAAEWDLTDIPEWKECQSVCQFQVSPFGDYGVLPLAKVPSS